MIRTILAFLFYMLVVWNCAQNAGDLDISFSNDGITTVNIAAGTDASYACILQTDGKIIATGKSITGQNSDFSLVRILQNGQLDPEFGNGGKVLSNFGSNHEYSKAIIMQSDGKIVIGGYRGNSWNYDFALIRYLQNGTVDVDFGINGLVTTDIIEDDYLYDIEILPDGKFLAVGFTENISGQIDVAIVKYNNDGSIDTSFGINGLVITAIGTSSDYGYTLSLQSDGKFIVSGYYKVTSTNHNVFVARYNSDGSLDLSFGTTGIVTFEVSTLKNEIYASEIQADGKIVLSGFTKVGNYFDVLVMRIGSSGILDSSFGSGGIIIKSIGSYDDFGRSLIVQPNNKIVISGLSITNNSMNYGDFFLCRINSDGTDDLDFGLNGLVVTSIGNGNDDVTSSLLQVDSMIVLSGYSSSQGYDEFAIARYFGECQFPNQTSSINGQIEPCEGTNQDYSVINSIGVNYNWSIPSDWIINNGQGSNSINVTVGPSDGNISVTPFNSCGNGPTSSIATFVNTIPSQPSTIEGSSSPCQGSTQLYSVELASEVTYSWSVPAGWIINNGQGSNSIEVTVGSNSGNISVTPANSCGYGSSSTLSVIVNSIPTQPTPIIGNINPCQGSSQGYSITNVPGVTYNWFVPDGWTINNGQGTSSISTTVGFDSGNIFVIPSNGCGDGIERFLSVTVNTIPAKADMPMGPTVVDLYYTNISEYNTMVIANADYYIWTLEPSNMGSINGIGTNITVSWSGFIGQSYLSVRAVNYCGEGLSSDTLDVLIDNTIGIGKTQKNSIVIYPNPNRGVFYIQSSEKISRIVFFDQLGKQIAEIQKPDENFMYDYSYLLHGVYYVHIIGDINVVCKLIISYP